MEVEGSFFHGSCELICIETQPVGIPLGSIVWAKQRGFPVCTRLTTHFLQVQWWTAIVTNDPNTEKPIRAVATRIEYHVQVCGSRCS